MRVTLVPDLRKYPHAWPMTWNLVEVWEPEPPVGTPAAHWLLWTLEPAASADKALEVVRKTRADGRSKTCTWYSRVAAGWRICGWRPGTDWKRP